jgi:hypothetical protein
MGQPTSVVAPTPCVVGGENGVPRVEVPCDNDGPDIGAGPEPPSAIPMGGEPYFAPGWPCSTGEPWVLDKSAFRWLCLGPSYEVVESVESPLLAAKVAAARAAGDMTYSDCERRFPGFVGGFGPGPCGLPDSLIAVDVD